ncbi:carbon-phosphorus lyase complex subunit PhnI [Peptoniphilus rhinitidis]|uniref:carbon-phosphorus lyase complex subunit PhnI n=1 Tax=Peptoniphilus rhinitidis TaxID=1175452 RepID=UPI00028980C5|nr:carbon-phosphorus lyase complex subunit PhnI [Peptoniphilus rhinitidis]
MAYVAVKGGQDAIKESNRLLDYDRVKDEQLLEIDVIKSELKDLLYQVMSESSLYDEDLAALAIKQAMGSMEEAVFLLRAHLSTLPRLYYTSVADPRNMHVERRISSSFKDIPGGQFLGKAYDFKQRFLNFDLTNENKEALKALKERFEKQNLKNTDINFTNLPKVVDYLIKEDLFNKRENDDREPDDITKKKIEFPSSRSQRLQSLTRGQTGAVTSLGYAKIRGFGIGSHPNIGELRVGDLSLYVNNNSEDEYYIGSIKVTEVEAFCASGNEDPSNPLGFEIGYGLVFGQNETKAIAMSVLDHSLEYKQEGDITGDDEFILLHIDSVESTGFISHLKLPHYVTFQSKLDGIRKIRKGIDYDK